MDANRIIIGNIANQVTAESWSWSVYVNCNDIDIKEISIHLHPTFKPNTYKLERTEIGKYQSKTFNGWGTFNIKVEQRGNRKTYLTTGNLNTVYGFRNTLGQWKHQLI